MFPLTRRSCGEQESTDPIMRPWDMGNMRVRWSLVVPSAAIAVTAGVLAVLRLGAASRASTACAAQAWSSEPAIFDLPAGLFLRNPLVSRNGPVTFVAGVLAGGGGLTAKAPALLVLKDGRDVGEPAGGFTFQAPQMVVDRGGILHLLWGERVRSDDPPDAPRRNDLPVSIWHSVLRQGRWSPAERVYVPSGDVQRFWWLPYVTAVSVDSANRLHVTVPGAAAGILHLSLDQGRWSVDTIPGAAVRTALAAGPPASLYLLYIGRQAGSRGRSQTVMVRRSQDGGRSWTQPELVRGGEPTYGRLHALLDAAGALHLLFGVVKDDLYHPAILRQTISNDHGHLWSRPRDLKIPAQRFTKWSVALDERGAEHVIVYTWRRAPGTSAPGRLFHAQMIQRGWSRGWSPLRGLTAVRTLREAEFSSGSAGVVDLLYSREIAPDDRGVAHYQLVRSPLKRLGSCERRLIGPGKMAFALDSRPVFDARTSAAAQPEVITFFRREQCVRSSMSSFSSVSRSCWPPAMTWPGRASQTGPMALAGDSGPV